MWRNAIARNWKTTMSGFVTAAASFVAFAPHHFGGEDAAIVNLAQFVVAGGLLSLGLTGKDFDKTGGR